MDKKKILLAALAAGLANVATAATNYSFESNFNGFTAAGNYEIIEGAAYGYTARQGEKFAMLSSDDDLLGWLDGVSTSTYGGSYGTILSTNLTLAAGEKFSFDWAFRTTDVMPYNDFALFIANGQQYSLGSVATVGDNQKTDWGTFTWQSTTPFSGTVSWVISNAPGETLDQGPLFGSNLMLDKMVVSPVPEPSTYLMMLAGLGMLTVVGVKRRT